MEPQEARKWHTVDHIFNGYSDAIGTVLKQISPRCTFYPHAISRSTKSTFYLAEVRSNPRIPFVGSGAHSKKPFTVTAHDCGLTTQRIMGSAASAHSDNLIVKELAKPLDANDLGDGAAKAEVSEAWVAGHGWCVGVSLSCTVHLVTSDRLKSAYFESAWFTFKLCPALGRFDD